MSDRGGEHDAISPPQRAAVPRLRVESPGGQWERVNQTTVTAEFEAPVRVPTRWLLTLPGRTGEERYLHAAHPHVIEYAQRIAAHGYDEFAATIYLEAAQCSSHTAFPSIWLAVKRRNRPQATPTMPGVWHSGVGK